jgi:predicted DCC family thiol-disulfide oxidoreductase YuxK
MVFDGDCHFCRRWIERWRETTGDQVDYAPFQEAGARFPEIPSAEFEREVKLIQLGGEVAGGAEAVVMALAHGTSFWDKLPLEAYRQAPGVAPVADFLYKIVARNRTAASALTRWLWGNDVRRPTYATAQGWFLRGLGLVYLLAFGALLFQIDGLIGPQGILPAQAFFDAVRTGMGGVKGFLEFPSVCWWIGAGPKSLEFLCIAGGALGIGLLFGNAPAFVLALLWVFYLSLTVAGQTFLSFQWDILLLEAGFLSIFLVPWKWWPGRAGSRTPGPRGALFLLRWLLFRFMLMSGVVKLTSGDHAWSHLTALAYHYQTQPLPTWLGWYAHLAAPWFGKLSTAFMFFVELAAPFGIWGPRRVRLVSFWLMLALQALIAATGNYGFFNLLTVVLCLLMLDDTQWPRWLRLAPPASADPPSTVQRRAVVALCVVYGVFGTMLLWVAFFPGARVPKILGTAFSLVEPFRSVNGYGLFRVMTRTRAEITIEGSNDGEHWSAYSFKWKPGDPDAAPGFVAPYMPRLDWQMWFAALGQYDDDPWFVSFLVQLLKGSPPVLGLLATNPFPQAPPRYIRAVIADYQFTDLAERRQTGAWWRVGPERPYSPAFSLRGN